MKSSFFAGNRQRLIAELKPSSLVVVAGFGLMQRDADQPFTFQQDAGFWYLTGIEEPDWQLMIDVDSQEEWLVAPTLNRYQQDFVGGLSAEMSQKISGARAVIDKKEAKGLLTKLTASKQHVYAPKPADTRVYGFQTNPAPRKLLATLPKTKLTDLTPTLNVLRGTKQPEEVEAIQRAVDVTVEGLKSIFSNLESFKTENQIDARLYSEYRQHGAIHGFEPVITSGAKTCILHVKASNDPLKQWLLIDTGARVDGYSADISRTVPMHKPSPRELEVYAAVQAAHDHFLNLLGPGADTKKVIKEGYNFMAEQMIKLGLIDKPLLDDKHVFKFMPHAISHGLGVDVHDPLGRPEHFKPGMVLTDEVGIYIPAEGFGIRIENDILITENGVRNLSAALPISLPELTKMVY